jgi:hypothetical protein
MTVVKGGRGLISGSVAGGVSAVAAPSCFPLATAGTVLAATCGGESESDVGRAVVSVGSDVAFAMAEGTVKKTWICRARNILKRKINWRRKISLDGDFPDDMYAVCECYSLISRTGNLHYHFCDVATWQNTRLST